MKRIRLLSVSLIGGVVSALICVRAVPAIAQGNETQSRVQQGLDIAPVPLDLQGKNGALVGLGSYLANALGGCNDCHTCPTYAPGVEHNPFLGGDGQLNADAHMAGGVPFGPIVSANLTPDAEGNPAGLTREEFLEEIRTGHDVDTGAILQVMPWPLLRNATDYDLQAMYEYLRAIPARETPAPGRCSAPGEATFPPAP
jgi:hypothetical protein